MVFSGEGQEGGMKTWMKQIQASLPSSLFSQPIKEMRVKIFHSKWLIWQKSLPSAKKARRKKKKLVEKRAQEEGGDRRSTLYSIKLFFFKKQFWGLKRKMYWTSQVKTELWKYNTSYSTFHTKGYLSNTHLLHFYREDK